MYRMLARVFVVGCADIQTDVPFRGELVVTELDGIIDLDVSGNVIRWTTNSTDGAQLHAAPLDQHPIIAREIVPHGTTQAKLLVDGETVYVTDYFGIMALTDGGSAQVIKDDFVSTLALDDNHDLVWGHVGFVSWLEGGIANVGIATVSHLEDIVVVGDQIYASTRTVRANGLVYGSLYRINKPARTATLISHAPAFASEFDSVSDHRDRDRATTCAFTTALKRQTLTRTPVLSAVSGYRSCRGKHGVHSHVRNVSTSGSARGVSRWLLICS